MNEHASRTWNSPEDQAEPIDGDHCWECARAWEARAWAELHAYIRAFGRSG